MSPTLDREGGCLTETVIKILGLRPRYQSQGLIPASLFTLRKASRAHQMIKGSRSRAALGIIDTLLDAAGARHTPEPCIDTPESLIGTPSRQPNHSRRKRALLSLTSSHVCFAIKIVQFFFFLRPVSPVRPAGSAIGAGGPRSFALTHTHKKKPSAVEPPSAARVTGGSARGPLSPEIRVQRKRFRLSRKSGVPSFLTCI